MQGCTISGLSGQNAKLHYLWSKGQRSQPNVPGSRCSRNLSQRRPMFQEFNVQVALCSRIPMFPEFFFFKPALIFPELYVLGAGCSRNLSKTARAIFPIFFKNRPMFPDQVLGLERCVSMYPNPNP